MPTHMSKKSWESLILKIVKKMIKNEIKNLRQDNLLIVSNQENHKTEGFTDAFVTEEDIHNTAEIIDDIYTNEIVNLSAKEDQELERKLQELKFKQELRKDWILFILKDVIVYSTTVLFLFTVAGFYLFTLIQR